MGKGREGEEGEGHHTASITAGSEGDLGCDVCEESRMVQIDAEVRLSHMRNSWLRRWVMPPGLPLERIMHARQRARQMHIVRQGLVRSVTWLSKVYNGPHRRA